MEEAAGPPEAVTPAEGTPAEEASAAAEPASSAPAGEAKSPAEKLQLAEKLREEGNAKFKAQDVAAARQDYEKALSLLRLGAGELATEAKATRVPVLLNLALCCLKVEPCEAFRALELCEEALDEEPQNTKAMYRKAKALIELDELKEAEWELVRACKLSPKDAALRRDLQQLKQRMRDDLAKEKASYEGLFERGAGFASDRREQGPAAASSKLSESDVGDIYFHDDKENPFESSEHPEEEAREMQVRGQLGDAVLAWEAALSQAAARKDWPEHFAHCLDFGRLFLDLNMDRLALRCFNKVLEPGQPATSSNAPDEPAPLPSTWRHALLLKAICLLNEAEGDPQAEVSDCLSSWLRCAWDGAPAAGDATPLEEQLSSWRRAEGAAAGADSAVALGLVELVRGKELAAARFADALRAPDCEGSCFGVPRSRTVKWNMLGAVLANRRRYEHALVAYAQALRLQPAYPRALMNRGLSQAALGEHVQAAASYARALELMPSWGVPTVWPLLKKAAEDTGLEDLAEATAGENLTRSLELLRPLESQAEQKEEPVADVLARIDLAS